MQFCRLYFQKHSQRHLCRGGFTLIEMVVTIGIIAMVMALTLTNYRAGNKGTALQLEAYKIAADLRRLQNMALSASEYSGSVPKGGWGFQYAPSATTYTLVVRPTESGAYTQYQQVSLQNNARFSSAAGATIMFIPPDPITLIDGVASGEKIITVTDGTSTRTITVNALGLIDVQ